MSYWFFQTAKQLLQGLLTGAVYLVAFSEEISQGLAV